jgi:hypothetical protein
MSGMPHSDRHWQPTRAMAVGIDRLAHACQQNNHYYSDATATTGTAATCDKDQDEVFGVNYPKTQYMMSYTMWTMKRGFASFFV